MAIYKAGKFFQASVAQFEKLTVQILHERLFNQDKAVLYLKLKTRKKIWEF